MRRLTLLTVLALPASVPLSVHGQTGVQWVEYSTEFVIVLAEATDTVFVEIGGHPGDRLDITVSGPVVLAVRYDEEEGVIELLPSLEHCLIPPCPSEKRRELHVEGEGRTIIGLIPSPYGLDGFLPGASAVVLVQRVRSSGTQDQDVTPRLLTPEQVAQLADEPPG